MLVACRLASLSALGALWGRQMADAMRGDAAHLKGFMSSGGGTGTRTSRPNRLNWLVP
jgi:hypothetical protein